MGISSSALLVEMGISVWLASKVDRNVTNEVTATKNAAHNAAQVRKNLMAGSSMRKKISDYAAECRLYHSRNTLAWSDTGLRLLPTSKFFDYKTELNQRRDKFESMVTEFVDSYPQLVQVAHNYLGDMFDPNDYPDVSEVRDKFKFKLVFSPVPESNDFRVDVAQQDLIDIKEQYESDYKLRLTEAMREPWDRLHKMLLHMADRLTETEQDKQEDSPTRRYHESLITNAKDMCELLQHLNINNDVELERARQQLEATLMGADIKTIRKSSNARETMKRNVDAILKQYAW